MFPKVSLLLLLAGICVLEARHHLHHKHSYRAISSLVSSVNSKVSQSEALTRHRRSVDDSSEETDEEAALKNTLKSLVQDAWKTDKLETLSDFLDALADSTTNLTVVGWENVLNNEGEVIGRNSIQLVLPPKPSLYDDDDTPVTGIDDDEDGDNGDNDHEGFPWETVNEVKEALEVFRFADGDASVTFEEFEDDGERSTLFYMDKDSLYVAEGDFALFNKTVTNATPAQIKSFISDLAEHKWSYTPAVWVFDKERNIVLEKSIFNPVLWGHVENQEKVPENILLKSPSIIAEVSLAEDEEDIPKGLALKFKEAFPQYQWTVLVDSFNYHVKSDIVLTLSFDNLGFFENTDKSYTVLGVKLNTSTK